MISVIIPCFNEAKTIEEIISRVEAIALEKEIIVVDDSSTDGTREILQNKLSGSSEHIKIYYHDRNKGKGAALRTG